jgi:CO/xanthine dehydrogenase Mo-binding subunit
MEPRIVTFDYGDTSLPSGTLAGGSSQTASIGAAISRRCWCGRSKRSLQATGKRIRELPITPDALL